LLSGSSTYPTAHDALEQLCLDKETLHYKQVIALKYADLVYNGQWFHPLRQALDAFIDKVQERTTGTVKVKLFKGRATVASTASATTRSEPAAREAAILGIPAIAVSQLVKTGIETDWPASTRMAAENYGYMGPVKAALIDDAHLMNVEAQNALLKTLEEPSGNAIIVLVAQNSGRLLETIRSRCQILQFNFVAPKELAGLAALKGNGNAAEIVRLSFGRPGRTVEFAADISKLKDWQNKSSEFARVVAAGLPERFAYAAKVSETEDLDQLLEVWQSHFRGVMLAALNIQKPESPAPSAKSPFVFSKLKNAVPASPQNYALILKKIHDLGMILQTTNASPKLAIENFMLEI